MSRGKDTCRILKEIRRRIAEANDIEYITSECRYRGDCLGTCPRCEAEVRYLEQQLERRRLSGRAVTLLGISAGVLTLGALPVAAQDETTTSTPTVVTPDPIPADTTHRTPATVLHPFILKGLVIDTKGRPVYDARVIEWEGANGTRTGEDGKFRLAISGNHPIFVNYLNTRMSENDPDERPDTLRISIEYNGMTMGEMMTTADFSCMKPADPPKENEEPYEGWFDYPYMVSAQKFLPMYPGGLMELWKHLNEQVQHPKGIDTPCEGRVAVQFTINEKGKVRGAHIIDSSLPKAYNREALRVINSQARWKSGLFMGMPRETECVFYVTFRRSEASFTLHGTVVDEQGTPLIGASVLIKNTNRGTLTDKDGRFSLPVSGRHPIVISYIGMNAREIVPIPQTDMTIILQTDKTLMGEIVVE